jgi:hypothetical protein
MIDMVFLRIFRVARACDLGQTLAAKIITPILFDPQMGHRFVFNNLLTFLHRLYFVLGVAYFEKT